MHAISPEIVRQREKLAALIVGCKAPLTEIVEASGVSPDALRQMVTGQYCGLRYVDVCAVTKVVRPCRQ